MRRNSKRSEFEESKSTFTDRCGEAYSTMFSCPLVFPVGTFISAAKVVALKRLKNEGILKEVKYNLAFMLISYNVSKSF